MSQHGDHAPQPTLDDATASLDGRPVRSLSNILVEPKGQLRYAFMLFGAGILMMITIVTYLLLSFNKTIEALHALYQVDGAVIDHLQMSLYSTLVMVIIFGVVLAAVTISIGIALSHRIFGPIIPLKRHVEALIAGQYESRVQLRKKDEFQDLATELNRLAAALEHK